MIYHDYHATLRSVIILKSWILIDIPRIFWEVHLKIDAMILKSQSSLDVSPPLFFTNFDDLSIDPHTRL